MIDIQEIQRNQD